MDKTLKVIALCGCLMSLGINGAHSETIEAQIEKIEKAGWSVYYKEDEFTDAKTASISKRGWSNDLDPLFRSADFYANAKSETSPVYFCIEFDPRMEPRGNVLVRVDKNPVHRYGNENNDRYLCFEDEKLTEELRHGKQVFVRTNLVWSSYPHEELRKVTFPFELKSSDKVISLLKTIQPNKAREKPAPKTSDEKPTQQNDVSSEKMTSREMLEMIFAP